MSNIDYTNYYKTKILQNYINIIIFISKKFSITINNTKMNYFLKYQKYKNKYFQLQNGGNYINYNFSFNKYSDYLSKYKKYKLKYLNLQLGRGGDEKEDDGDEKEDYNPEKYNILSVNKLPLREIRDYSDVEKTLDDFAKRFLNELMEHEYNRENIKKHLQEICNIIITIDEYTLNKLTDVFEIIHKIINCEINIWEIEEKNEQPVKYEQKEKSYKLSTLFNKVMENNWHVMPHQCKDPKKCNNEFIDRERKEHLFKCSYHEFDSLSVHLVLASILNGIWSINNKNNDKQIMLATLLGLFHDIGKPVSIEYGEHRENTYIGFPAHAEIGAIMFQALWSKRMHAWITYEEFMLVRTAILKHMCGYHKDENTPGNKYKRELLLLEQDEVRKLLGINRVGDELGKMGMERVNLINFVQQQHIFEEQMKVNNPNIFTNILEKYKFDSNKIAILLIGTSGSGKTYLANLIKENFNAILVSRDECITEICVGMKNFRPENEDYIKMYSIYKIGKDLNPKKQKRSRDDQNKINQAFINAQKEWNEYAEQKGNLNRIPIWDEKTEIDIVGDVQKLHQQKITDALNSDKQFIIIDSMVNLFPNGFNANVPDSLKKIFRVHIHVQSFMEYTESSISKNIKEG